jgi:hypothetical protein
LRFDNVPSGWSDSSTERFSGWDIIPTQVPKLRSMALLNQGMNANCASYPKVSLGLGFKNPTREDSYLKSATPLSG